MNNQRTCDGCMACCITHGVIELLKIPGVRCRYCSIGKGCAIYSNRPTACREFKCSWLIGLGLAEYRPDKTKIVPEHKEIPGLGLALWLYETNDGSLDSEFAKRQTRLNLKVGNSVMHLPLIGRPKLYLSEGKESSGFAFSVDMKRVEVISFAPERFPCPPSS